MHCVVGGLLIFQFFTIFLVMASHKLVLILSLPFLRMARRVYRWSDPVNNSEMDLFSFAEHVFPGIVKRRNTVSVRGLAEGSVTHSKWMFVHAPL